MSQIFDCTCRLRVQTPDRAELHRLLSSFERLPDERDDVIGALFANGQQGEQVNLMLAAQDVATARALAKGILAEIEQHLLVRFGADAVSSEAVVIREVQEGSTRREGMLPDDGFSSRIHAELRHFRRQRIEDPESALRAARTAGPDGTPTTEDVLAKLDEWRVFSRFDVVDVGVANLTLYFKELPQQLHRFAEEVLLFCPEVTDEVNFLDELDNAPPAIVARVAVEGIANNLRNGMTLRLWWD